MASTAASPALITRSLPGQRYDHIFFSTLAWLILLTVFAGFAQTYYLAGLVTAKLPSTIIHVHAVVFSCWMLLLITQTSLAASGRIHIHRRLGIAGFVLASLMIVIGPWAAIDMLVRGGPVGRDPRAFFAIPLSTILIFAALVVSAFRARRNPPVHKRLIILATVGLLPAAITRWPMAVFHHNTMVSMWSSYVFALLVILYDLWSSHKIHRVTLAASAFLIVIGQAAFPIGRTGAWHGFARWVESMVR
jgi:FtsH-binding integral membrane protein